MDFNQQLNDLLLHIGKKLADIRHSRNEKLHTVAKAIEISTSTISRIENGRYACLSTELILKLANHYEIGIDELFMKTSNNCDK